MLRSRAAVAIQEPHIPALAVVLRVVSILGMGMASSLAILLLIAAEWLWAGIAAAAFAPSLSLMYVVDRLIPSPDRVEQRPTLPR